MKFVNIYIVRKSIILQLETESDKWRVHSLRALAES